MLIKFLALLGGGFFAFAAWPTAIKTFNAKKSLGTPIDIAWYIVLGCISLYAYLTISHGFDWALSVVYGIEISAWLIIIFYHYKNGK